MMEVCVISAFTTEQYESIKDSDFIRACPFAHLVGVVGLEGSEPSEAGNENPTTIGFPKGYTKAAVRNALIKTTRAEFVLFIDERVNWIDGAKETLLSFLENHPQTSVFAYAQKQEGKVHRSNVYGLPLFSFVFRREDLLARGIWFHGLVKERDYLPAIECCFIRDALSWPARFVVMSHPIVNEAQTLKEMNMANVAYFRTHCFGPLWWLPVGIKGEKRFSPKGGWAGHTEYLAQWLGLEKKKTVPLGVMPFVISLIALFGAVSQAALALVITFTETQYIPIWLSLLFIALFVVIYAFSVRKVGRPNYLMLAGVGTALLSVVALLIALLCLHVSPALSVFGGILCAVFSIGLVYCLRPSASFARCSDAFIDEN